MATPPNQRIKSLEQENAELRRQLDEAMEYQTATSDVLKAISRSAFDLQLVLDTLIETAAVLCGANAATGIAIRQGDVYRHVAMFSHDPDWVARVKGTSFVPDRSTVGGRVALAGEVVHVTDLAIDPDYDMPEAITMGRMRTLLGVPLLREGEPIGVLLAGREKVEPFTERQIELLRSFADQAVIAIENARLIAETREALEQQTATAEVLQVINASPGDLAPVFEAMLEKAIRLCESDFGILWKFDDGQAVAAALHQVPAAYAELVREPFKPSPESGPARMMRGDSTFVVADLLKFPPYQAGDTLVRAMVDLARARSVVIAPLRKDGATMGAITIYRQEVRPFSDKQIALLQNFAAQAVIAMENARLITETREALEQQTATAEVLRVINASPGDLAPVFDAMLEKAARLCEAAYGIMFAVEGDRIRIVAERNVPKLLSSYLAASPPGIGQDTMLGRALLDRKIMHTTDPIAETPYREGVPLAVKTVELGGARAFLMAPLTTDEAVHGVFALFRTEARAFTEKQIALLENFAAQAVIAMENARLITETREALDQQTATAEVLGVINSSPGDLAPVFDAMLDKAIRLCDAVEGVLWTIDGEHGRVAAAHGLPTDFVASLSERSESRTNPLLERVMRGEHLIHIPDTMQSELYGLDPLGKAAVEAGVRTLIWIALVKNGVAVGAFAIGRREVRPFTDKQIALLQNFAAQAVIAMENARLLDELRQRTEEVAGLNRGLEARVAAQVDELGRVGNLKRFLPPQVAEMVVSQGDERILESHRREIVVVFCDVRGYTAFSETAEPEEVIEFLGDYHAALGPLITRFEGTLSHFLGDGLMVFFNDPVPCPDPAERAVKMAVAMREAAGGLVAAWGRRGHQLGFGAGVAQGYATLGQIGFADRSDYTAIGTVCNLAARLCGEAQDGQILLARRVAVAVEGGFVLEELGSLTLKGLTQPVAAFNVARGVGLTEAASA
jgi:GAF domain-containing protein